MGGPMGRSESPMGSPMGSFLLPMGSPMGSCAQCARATRRHAIDSRLCCAALLQEARPAAACRRDTAMARAQADVGGADGAPT